jgi:hypothetical protein
VSAPATATPAPIASPSAYSTPAPRAARSTPTPMASPAK